MRDRSFVVQMMLLAVGLAVLWTWALQSESNDRQQRADAVLQRARRAAAAEEMRTTAPVRSGPNATTSSSLLESVRAAGVPARASTRERISPSKS